MVATDPGLAKMDVDVFTILERTTSVFSLLGSLFVITTFTFSKAFHKPINRLVFYATFGNLMTNVATLMARSFISDTNSAGCQLQGFLIQMYGVDRGDRPCVCLTDSYVAGLCPPTPSGCWPWL